MVTGKSRMLDATVRLAWRKAGFDRPLIEVGSWHIAKATYLLAVQSISDEYFEPESLSRHESNLFFENTAAHQVGIQ